MKTHAGLTPDRAGVGSLGLGLQGRGSPQVPLSDFRAGLMTEIV